MIKNLIGAFILFVVYKIIKWFLYVKKCENYWRALYNLQRQYSDFFEREKFRFKEMNTYNKNKVVEYEYIRELDIQREFFKTIANLTTKNFLFYLESRGYDAKMEDLKWHNQDAYRITLIINGIETKLQVLNVYNEIEKTYKMTVVLNSEL